MDDEELFGPVFYQLSFGEAIQRDLLSDYQVVIVGVDDSTYREYAERGRFVTRDGKEVTDARSLASSIALAKAMRKYDLRRTISFHSRIERACRFANEFPDVVAWMPRTDTPKGGLWCDHVSGRMPSGERDARLDLLRGLNETEHGLLSNARCLGEGVDVPTLDGVAFIDPRSSQVDIVQAVGRALRKAQDKRIGSILLPVFIDSMDDPDVCLNSSAFRPIWSVLRALRAHDERLADELDGLRRMIGQQRKRFSGSLPSRIKFDLPISIDRDFVEAFKVKLVERSTANWEFWFGLLTVFAEREGSASPAVGQVEEDFRLGEWVHNQRRAKLTGFLDADRATRLEALPGWTWDAVAALWEDCFLRLLAFADREGHASPAFEHIEGDFWLGSWVNSQRQAKRKGTLNADRAARLEALPGWKWKPKAEAWEDAFSRLAAFAKREGHAAPAPLHAEDGFELGRWVTIQRRAYKKKWLVPERAAKLDALPGWKWQPHTDAWEDGFSRLAAFAEREGYASPTEDHIENGIRLGVWVGTQRQAKRKGTLSADRAARLEALPGWKWHAHAGAWEDAFSRLVVFAERNGHATPPQLYVEDGFRLGEWVSRQRQAEQRGKLSRKRAARLQTLPGWLWEPHAEAWEDAFSRLVAFTEREGHASPAGGHVENGIRLGRWVRVQRQAKRKGTLSADRAVRLEALPGWKWKPHTDPWEDGFRRLVVFVERQGHSSPAFSHVEDGLGLGGWVRTQRRAYKRNKLDPEKKANLEALPGWTWDTSAAAWEDGFSKLISFAKREGHASPPLGCVEDDFQLGFWVGRQRYARRKGTLGIDRATRLEGLPGWEWKPRAEAWEEGFSRLLAFAVREGHASPKVKHVEGDYKLGFWVANQRQAHRRGKLDNERVGRLQALRGWRW